MKTISAKIFIEVEGKKRGEEDPSIQNHLLLPNGA
jgi:hypothetical protein